MGQDALSNMKYHINRGRTPAFNATMVLGGAIGLGGHSKYDRLSSYTPYIRA